MLIFQNDGTTTKASTEASTYITSQSTTTVFASSTTTKTYTSETLPTTEWSTDSNNVGPKFSYPVVLTHLITLIIASVYIFLRWRQKGKSMYIIPRVFVLCSPRTVQFHYELILRIGLPSYDFNPEKHDIDLTVLGQQKNEIVPMTRLNTKTLVDEPLITSLSIIVYRLVEMPQLGSLILRHSGPFKSWVYAYDFTMINLSTNKEHYYTLNQYVGSLNRILSLDEIQGNTPVHYPIDDVPLPQWSLEDVIVFIFLASSCIILSVTLLPINCSYTNDIVSIIIASLVGGSVVFFLHWLYYYYIKWNQDRKDYFNEFDTAIYCPNGIVLRIILSLVAIGINAAATYFTWSIDDWRSSLVWLLVLTNTYTLVIGCWNIFRQAEFGERLLELGLKLRGIDMIGVGMRYSDMVADIRTKSNSASDDGGGSSISGADRFQKSFGPRSSVKSFGFDPITGHPSKKGSSLSKFDPHMIGGSRISATGATPNNHPSSHIMRPGGAPRISLGFKIAQPMQTPSSTQAPRSQSATSKNAATNTTKIAIKTPSPVASSSNGSSGSHQQRAVSEKSHSGSDKKIKQGTTGSSDSAKPETSKGQQQQQ